jgi:hypothetical protein
MRNSRLIAVASTMLVAIPANDPDIRAGRTPSMMDVLRRYK